MPIDIVRKNKKSSTNANLRRQMVEDKNDKKGLEERLEKRFSHLPELAYKQKIKIMWSTVIFLCGIIVIFWFYLASRGVLFRAPWDKEAKGDLIKLSDLTSGFNKLKDISIGELSDNKNIISSLKDKLELAVAKNEVIENLKDNLQKKTEGEYDGESDKVVCDSGNLIATYPLPNYYIDNPVKILGRGKLPSGEFNITLEDSNGKILGESNGMTEKGQTMSSFTVELSYSNPETKTGTLQLYTLSQEDENKNDLISIPVNFILDLQNWNIYNNEEFGIEFKYPKNSAVASTQNRLSLNKNEESVDGKEKMAGNKFYFDCFSDIGKFQESYTSAAPLLVYESLDSFLESGNLEESKKPVYIGGLKFHFLFGARVFEKDTGEIVNIRTNGQDGVSLEILDQILATFRLAEPNLEKWKEYKDIAGEISFKYPDRLNDSEELGQSIFRDQDPDGFSFYFFTIEPQIDNLEKWIKESAINSEEEVVKYEDKGFGDAVLGVYYEAKDKKDDATGEEDVQNSQRSFGYIFNHYGTTYSLRTNNENFQNTFKNVLNSIKFNSLDDEKDLNFESN